VLTEKIGSTDTAFMSSLSALGPAARTSAVNAQIATQISRLLTFEFSRDRKLMSVLVKRIATGQDHLFVKGAPEAVLERCSHALVGSSSSNLSRIPLTPSLRATLLQTATQTYGSAGLRSLALAYSDVASTNAEDYLSESSADYARFERDLTFVSLVGMLDPPRPEVRAAVQKLRGAGIRVICITGDNKGTAETICRQVGIFDEDEDLAGKSFTGREFDGLSFDEKIKAVKTAGLFSRTEPGHKSQLVDLMQGLGLVVAMTGGEASYNHCRLLYVSLTDPDIIVRRCK
jgi:Ca2+ transporting ATPase